MTYIFKNKKSLSFKIVSTMMLLSGILWIPSFLLGGITLGIFSLLIIVPVEGLEIDMEERKYRNIIIIGNQSFGNWKYLPEIKYISVFRTIIVSSIVGRSGATVSNREKTILINFIHGKNQRLRVYKTDNVEDAFLKAKYFSEKLNLRIFDATSKKGKWLE
jgi:hypothetical protein